MNELQKIFALEGCGNQNGNTPATALYQPRQPSASTRPPAHRVQNEIVSRATRKNVRAKNVNRASAEFGVHTLADFVARGLVYGIGEGVGGKRRVFSNKRRQVGSIGGDARRKNKQTHASG